jgi:RNA polymerase sigma-70 factor (ECF subfamily)
VVAEEPPRATDALGGAVARARTGDEAAFAHLFNALQPRLLRYLRMRCGPSYQDVASETWLRVIRDLHRFEGDGDGFVAWLFTIARYRAIDAARDARRAPVQLPSSYDAAGHGADVEDQVLDRLSVAEMRALLSALPVDQADAVALRHVAGLDVATVAALLGKSATAVRISCHRGLRRLAMVVERGTPDRVGAVDA